MSERSAEIDVASIRIGTSGYSFPDWVGPFYPPGTRSGDFLSWYARHFDIVEINSTYYRIPHPRVLEQMERKTPDSFRFIAKLHRSMTHETHLVPSALTEFRAALEPLRSARKLNGLLAQFPWAFRRSAQALSHLDRLREALPGDPLFVEFRHDSWNTPDLSDVLRERSLGYCAVDEPRLQGLMPPIAPLTAEDAYVRFHGRNAKNWWAPAGSRERGSGDRYDWEYTPAELGEWVAKIAELSRQARRTYLFFNNCHAGQAARSAKLMQEMLRQQRLPA